MTAICLYHLSMVVVKELLVGNTNGEVKLKYATNTKLETTSGGVDVTGNITVSGTVDGRDIASDGSKLDGSRKWCNCRPNSIRYKRTRYNTIGTITSGTWN